MAEEEEFERKRKEGIQPSEKKREEWGSQNSRWGWGMKLSPVSNDIIKKPSVCINCSAKLWCTAGGICLLQIFIDLFCWQIYITNSIFYHLRGGEVPSRTVESYQ
jgi:hypothetical protein